MCIKTNFSTNLPKAWVHVCGAIDTYARVLGNKLDLLIMNVHIEVKNTKANLQIKRIFSYVSTAKIYDSDTTTQVIKKVAFDLFISLPMAVLMRNIMVYTNFSYMPTISILGLSEQLLTSVLYIYVVMPCITFMLFFLGEEVTEEPNIPHTEEDSFVEQERML